MLPSFLSNPIFLALAGAVVVWLRSNQSNPLVEKLLSAFRVLTNTPAKASHMHDMASRIQCAKEMAAEFSKRGKGDVAKAIIDAVPVLIEEGTVS